MKIPVFEILFGGSR